MFRNKKPAALVLALALILSSMGLAAAAPSDVVGLPCEQAVVYLIDLGIVAGYPDGTIRPEGTITRAEAVKVIIVAKYGDETLANALAAEAPFDDVPAIHWASGHIALAKGQGIVEGHGDGTFGPDDSVTYAQFAKMLVEAAGLTGDQALTWPDNYVSVAGAAGILTGVPAFAAAVNAPRGDCFIMAAYTVESVADPVTGQTLAQSVFGRTPAAPVVNETQQTEHATLAAAIQAATAGDVIAIPAGTYQGNISVGQHAAGIILRGAGVAETTVKGNLLLAEEASGIHLEALTIDGDAKITHETIIKHVHILGDLDAAPAGGSKFTEVAVDGDFYATGTEFDVQGLAVGGDAYIGGPHIYFDETTYGGTVYGAALYALQLGSSAEESLLAGSEEAQDAYIAFTVGGTDEGDYNGAMAAARQVTIEVVGLEIDEAAAWTVSHPGILSLEVARIDDWISMFTLTVKEGQTLAAATTVEVYASAGVLRTSDWGQVKAERDKTMPWAQFEYRLDVKFTLAPDATE